MGILRVVEWRSTQPVDQTDALIHTAMEPVSWDPASAVGTIEATAAGTVSSRARVGPYL
jgi:hypothetical protein